MDTFVYCHGYGSSSKSDKVDRMKKALPHCEVLAFDADIDPNVAIAEVGEQILDKIIEDHTDGKLILIGTSLGAWLASTLADKFDCLSILINPTPYPAQSLKKYGVDQEICRLYKPMSLERLNKKMFYIDQYDEIIDQTELIAMLPVDRVVLVPNAGHRFNGIEFENMLVNINK